MDWHQRLPAAGDAQGDSNTPIPVTKYEDYATLSAGRDARVTLAVLPNEVLLHVLGFLDVSDLLATSRVSSRLLIPMEGGDFLFLDGVHVAMDVSTMCLPDHRDSYPRTCFGGTSMGERSRYPALQFATARKRSSLSTSS